MIETTKIAEAKEFAKKAHEGQKRKIENCDYIEHPIAVVEIAEEYGDRVNEDTICACLLHDVVEDTPVTLEEIAEKFGKEVAFLVDGVTKEDAHEKTLEKIKKYAEKDKRVLLIKLADRIYNMSTIDSKKMPDTFKRYKSENIYYIKLGRKLRLNYITNKLCELHFS